MTRRSACWCATDARPWRRYFSTSRAAAAKHARPRNERAVDQCRDLGAASHRRDGAALCLPLALILDPACRADLLAGGPTLGVGFSAVLYRPEFRVFCALERRFHRRRADVGRAVSRPARLLGVLPWSARDPSADPPQCPPWRRSRWL